MTSSTTACRPKIVVTHWIHEDVAAELHRIGEPFLNQTRETLPREEILRRCREADALMVFMPDSVDQDFLAACPRLRIISAALKGFDNFDVAACTRRGVWFTIVPELLSQATAELALGLLLAVTRNIPAGDREVRSGRFSGWKPTLFGMGVSGGTAGIVGYGGVGRALAPRLAACGARVVYADRCGPAVPENNALASFRPFDRLLQESDFIFPLLPLDAETRHLFGPRTLASMKRGSYLVNCGRGSLVDESAVAAALASGQLAGYAADVFEMEDWARGDRPRQIAPALLDPAFNTVFTPHLGSAVDSVRRDIAREAACRFAEWSRGERPRYAVNDVGADQPSGQRRGHPSVGE
jgi:phosphonate dehydrogenase